MTLPSFTQIRDMLASPLHTHIAHTQGPRAGTGLCRHCLSQLTSSMQRFLKFIAFFLSVRFSSSVQKGEKCIQS